jgi:UDP-N-acetyl-D-galactosamine dehydrogenase
MSPGSTVIFESTVYPGATEEICVPALEASSGLKWKKDFFVGYSPERINPGDRVRKLPDIKKIVAGDSLRTLGLVSQLYKSIITAGVFEAESIQVAEAAKIMENTQRDINIALINECAMIFNKLNINTSAVLEAAGTKWNFLPFRPGLVGGHCIGVDPYYLTEKAEMAGHHPKMILAGRDINDGMAKYIALQTIKTMLGASLTIKGARILIMGLTFKEDVSDLRNSKVIDLIRELTEYRTTCLVHDPEADSLEASEHYKIALTKWDDVPVCDVAIIAVPHHKFLKMGLERIKTKITPGGCLIDVKSSFRRADVEKLGLSLWQL